MSGKSLVERIVANELSNAFGRQRIRFRLDWEVSDDEVAEPVLNVSVRLPRGERPKITRSIAMLPIAIRQALARKGQDILVHVWFPEDTEATTSP